MGTSSAFQEAAGDFFPNEPLAVRPAQLTQLGRFFAQTPTGTGEGLFYLAHVRRHTGAHAREAVFVFNRTRFLNPVNYRI